MRSLSKPHSIANEVRLKRTQHAGSFLLVEGPDDSRFYRRFVAPRQCQLVVGFNKENVISAVRILEDSRVDGVLGVVDSDFDALDGTSLPSANLVSCGCHDLEAMLIRSPALDAVLHEHCSPEKLAHFVAESGAPFREWLLGTALPIGYLRWNSLKAGLGLRFEGLNFSNFVDARTLAIERMALLKELRNRSQNWAIPNDQLIANGWPDRPDDDVWQVCCGHDMVELLTLALRRAVGSQKNLSTEQIARSLRLAYSRHEFNSSELHEAVACWEERSGFAVLSTSEET
jgi:Protein of unknown function (DUF4435)